LDFCTWPKLLDFGRQPNCWIFANPIVGFLHAV
jgi:hypothetical protein